MYKHKHCLWFTVDIFLNWEGSRVQRLVQGSLTGPWLSTVTCSWHSKQWQSDGNYVIHLSFGIIFNVHFCVHRNLNWRKQNDHYPVISFSRFTYLSPWQQSVRHVVTTSGRQTSQSRLFWEWSFTNLLLLSARLSGFDTNLLLNKTLYRLPALIPQSRLCCFLVWKRISVKCGPPPKLRYRGG